MIDDTSEEFINRHIGPSKEDQDKILNFKIILQQKSVLFIFFQTQLEYCDFSCNSWRCTKVMKCQGRITKLASARANLLYSFTIFFLLLQIQLF